MHGYGYPPEWPPQRRPSPATLNLLRVVFVTLTVVSCGFLAWGAMLRLAIVTRRRRDWVLLAVVFVLNVGLFVFILATPDDPEKMTDTQALIGMGWLIGVVAGVIAYYLYTDLRHFGTEEPYGRYGGPRPGHLPSPHVPPGYGAYVPHPTAAGPPPAGYGYPPAPAPQAPVPPPASPAVPPRPAGPPQRLDQVRAELDELSHYLRKEGDGR
ncbi:hypothetical protein [Streptomyces sp. JH34]|uniref:hypothetical protein n=1 Tax=Streptomyces sp. JH34 TaxID=2793633 RepID=UPI0023F73B4C|nr:hypothetical protein [Streptomyces sp. JH34]MDF6020572.1 hypothetical protein [Streptomyces sp. JH34]